MGGCRKYFILILSKNFPNSNMGQVKSGQVEAPIRLVALSAFQALDIGTEEEEEAMKLF
jgi:hypothetical protein